MKYTYNTREAAEKEAKAKKGTIKENKRKKGSTYTVRFKQENL